MGRRTTRPGRPASAVTCVCAYLAALAAEERELVELLAEEAEFYAPWLSAHVAGRSLRAVARSRATLPGACLTP